MLRSLTARQFQQWLLYLDIEPIESLRADYRAAQIVSMLANINRDTKKRANPFTPEDFLLKFSTEESHKKEEPKRQSWQEQKMIAQMFSAAFAPKRAKGKS